MSTTANRAAHPVWDIPPAWPTAARTTGLSVVPSPVLSKTFGVAIVVAVTAPWLVHLIPVSGAPLGPALLPIFYAPMLAAFMLRLPVAVAVSVATPIVSRFLTDMPPDVIIPALMLQIAFFVAAVRLLRGLPWVGVAPVAYVASLASAAILSRLIGIATIDVAATIQVGWLGIAVLAGLGLVADRLLRRRTH